MPGGFFYGAYLADRLLSHEDNGIPGGYISGELMAGIVLGNNALTTANLLSQLLPVVGKPATPFKAYLDTIEIQPTVQYHLNLASVGMEQLSAFKPYALAGPGIWISTLSTPVVVGKFPVPGQVPGDRYRHSDADVQPGGVFRARVRTGAVVPACRHAAGDCGPGPAWAPNGVITLCQRQEFPTIHGLYSVRLLTGRRPDLAEPFNGTGDAEVESILVEIQFHFNCGDSRAGRQCVNKGRNLLSRAESDSELGSWIGPEFDAASDLSGQGTHQLHSQSFGLAKIKVRRKAYSVVSDEQSNLVVFDPMDLDSDLSASASGKSILEAVRDKLIDDQTKWNRRGQR